MTKQQAIDAIQGVIDDYKGQVERLTDASDPNRRECLEASIGALMVARAEVSKLA